MALHERPQPDWNCPMYRVRSKNSIVLKTQGIGPPGPNRVKTTLGVRGRFPGDVTLCYVRFGPISLNSALIPQPSLASSRSSFWTIREVEGSQCGSLRFSLEGNELNAESGVLHRDGDMTTHEESHETKQGQDEDRHEPRFLVSPALKVTSLRADRLLASHNIWKWLFITR
jgi:hypothetical protein